MKNRIRTAILTIAITAVSLGAAAQKGQTAAGGNVAVGFGNDFTNFGVGAKYQYGVTDPIRVEGAFTFFLPKALDNYSKLGMWDISVNGHYLFPTSGGKATIYPLAGLGLLGWKMSSKDADIESVSDTLFGVNVGAGADYAYSKNITLNAEAKYLIRDNMNRFVISAGVAYKF